MDIHEKSVGVLQSPVPRTEALALPISVERATQKPTPICISHHRHTLYTIRYTSGLVTTHPWTSTVASFLTEIETCEISVRQEQSVK